MKKRKLVLVLTAALIMNCASYGSVTAMAEEITEELVPAGEEIIMEESGFSEEISLDPTDPSEEMVSETDSEETVAAIEAGIQETEVQSETPSAAEEEMEILTVEEVADADSEQELFALEPTSIDIQYGMFQTTVKVDKGKSAVLNIVAVAKEGAALSYQWYQYVASDSSDGVWTAVEGATADSVTIPNVQSDMSVKCVITSSIPGSDGSKSKEVVYSVKTAFVDSGLAVDGEVVKEDSEVDLTKTLRVITGTSVELSAKVHTNSEKGLTYNWVQIQYDSESKKDVEIPVGTGASYTVPSVTQQLKYKMTVDDGYHTASVTFTVTPDDRMSNISDLAVGTQNTATVAAAGDKVLFRIVPSKTAMYVIYSVTDQDTCANLYDSQWNKLTNDDDSGEKNNFGIKFPMIAGETYYLEAWFYNVKATDVGSFGIMMQESASSKIVEVERKAATCVENGYVVYYTGAYSVKSGYSTSEKSTVQQTLPVDPEAHSYDDYTVVTPATALASGTKTRTCKLCKHVETVTIEKLEPTITVNAKKLVLQVKHSTTALKVTGLAEGDYVKSYKSSNKKIVTVGKKGKITAKNEVGTAKITITLASGLKKVVKVTVQKDRVKTKKITNIPGGVIIKKGYTMTLEPKITPITTADKLTFSSSDKTIASVSKKGVIKAKKKGIVTITIKSGDVVKQMLVKVAKEIEQTEKTDSK